MQAVIFDMDGVIIDSEPVHRHVELQFFSEYGIPVTEEELLGYMGMTSRGTFEAVREAHLREWEASGLSVDRAFQVEQQRYWDILSSNGVPFVPGAPDLIRQLHGRGWLVGVASSAPRRQILYVLERGGLNVQVKCIRGAEDISRGKPDPEIYLSAAACLGVEPGACRVVEDSANGTRAAVSAGMPCIVFTGTHVGEPHWLSGLRMSSKVPVVAADTMEAVAAAIMGTPDSMSRKV